MEVLLLFVMIIGLLFLGVPIGVALGISSIIFQLVFSDTSLASVAQSLYLAMAGHYTLLAIPFFVLASSFMSTGGVAKRIIRFAIACVGHLQGGLAIAGVLACMMFAALSGSSPATVVAIGSIVIAAMRQVGYTKEFAAGVICNAGTLGILIPPSIVMVVYASATDVSVGRMFLAGVIPGILAGTMLMITIYIFARIKNMPSGEWKGWGEIWESFQDAFWGLLLIVIIMGGIYGHPWVKFDGGSLFYWKGGAFTPTEAAAVAAVYAFFVASFIYRDMGPLAATESGGKPVALFRKPIAVVTAFFHRDTRATLFDGGKLTITLMFIIANALLLKHVLTDEQIPQQIAGAMLDAGLNWVVFLIVVNVILLIGGQFMEPSGLIVIVAPLVFPIAIELGIDPIHLGIIMVVNMEIGMITPPVGLNLFVTSGVAGMPMMSVVRAALPFLAVLFVFLIMVTYIPAISTWLPTMMMGPEIITK
ncbi:TRAP transporter large permease [Sulfitobacter pseudonitzschiae]|uniref:TRAP transporter large permease n=1 Tax=Pseudosulfitobacter pseudonitzschiae TaxID=1402135 RepID=A0A9Q2RW74_9RHOB|nr:TRAP transporter large permease [Pseudosulfitobacter pseudonitzschiae]MBM2291126.1 TRAP transporter large permease [Pseudosulfitobacter pseudonitzschiae]MBM2296044.1 TRAP transporter large permease [Pseudosulfitobacter pseudonitzschiae]MBM2300957.1 TRAP transporter large permease [Pseudosulfitobacter pseudonitzschiae]MBM2310741.1 TRAP transporter large permease [Pseudosulfitobacter pseudonitzschiae]MBM2315654.1 TRAP transporter large permease [Pseudosulfitobacter pseudonitzschiae]